MAGKVFCAEGGYLVGTAYPLAQPDDPALRSAELRADEPRGCAHLHCLGCEREIKIWDDQDFKVGVTIIWIMKPPPGAMARDRAEIERTYEAAEPNPGLKPAPGVRAYSCRCLRVGMRNYEALAESSLPHRWRCCGHPS